MNASTQLGARPKHKRMLVVDQDPAVCNTVKRLFSDEFNVDVVHCGHAALRNAHIDLPDVVLMDYNLPDMHGSAVCQELTRDTALSSTPVLFMTAANDSATQIKCWKAGCADFISKPMVVETLRHRVDSHVRIKQQVDSLKRQSLVDELTQTLNRRYLNESLQQHLSALQRSNVPFSIALIDIDQFKHYNDAYGNMEGDRCLISVADVSKNVLHRPTDTVYRFGGEEFVIVMPGVRQGGVEHICESIHIHLERMGMTHPTSACGRVTVSIGAVVVNKKMLTTEELLFHADEMVYMAKAKGRNQTRIKVLV